jgi:hypothetical protein
MWLSSETQRSTRAKSRLSMYSATHAGTHGAVGARRLCSGRTLEVRHALLDVVLPNAVDVALGARALSGACCTQCVRRDAHLEVGPQAVVEHSDKRHGLLHNVGVAGFQGDAPDLRGRHVIHEPRRRACLRVRAHHVEANEVEVQHGDLSVVVVGLDVQTLRARGARQQAQSARHEDGAGRACTPLRSCSARGSTSQCTGSRPRTAASRLDLRRAACQGIARSGQRTFGHFLAENVLDQLLLQQDGREDRLRTVVGRCRCAVRLSHERSARAVLSHPDVSSSLCSSTADLSHCRQCSRS